MRTSRIPETPLFFRLITGLLLLSATACTSISDNVNTRDRTATTAQSGSEVTPPTPPSKSQKPQPAKVVNAASTRAIARPARANKTGQLTQLKPRAAHVPAKPPAPPSAPERSLPTNTPVPGGIALLTVGATIAPAPTVTFNQAPVYVTRRANDWVAAVGISLKAEPGEHSVTITRGDQPAERLLFNVVDTEYKTQSLTIANKRKVNPNPDDQARIERDWVQIQKAKTTFNTNALPELALKWPLKGRISSEFGLRRIYNGQPRNPHSGLDIAAPTGTPIVAPSAGTVIETGDFFFNGQTAFVDHGHGLVTMYCHMSKIVIEVGDTLKPGDTIGLVGETGRVTGPHLHLGVLLNGQMVNPTLLLRD